LKAIRGLNALLLELLCSKAASSSAFFPLPPDLRARLGCLPKELRDQIAACGVLLADVGFSDPKRWSDALHQTEEGAEGISQGWASQDEAIALAHATLLVSWQVVHLSRSLAIVLLGMAPEIADRLGDMDLTDLTYIARRHCDWVGPRWPQNPRAWATLLDQSTQGINITTYATLRWLQLSGGHSPSLSSWVDRKPGAL
jgi:hypothetical protein